MLWLLIHLVISRFIVKNLFSVPVDEAITLIVNHVKFSVWFSLLFVWIFIAFVTDSKFLILIMSDYFLIPNPRLLSSKFIWFIKSYIPTNYRFIDLISYLISNSIFKFFNYLIFFQFLILARFLKLLWIWNFKFLLFLNNFLVQNFW